MVRHVTQFPNDADCYRFIATISEKVYFLYCSWCSSLHTDMFFTNRNKCQVLFKYILEQSKEIH